MLSQPNLGTGGTQLQLQAAGLNNPLAVASGEGRDVVVRVARWSGPALTTVHRPLIEMAEEAARMVLLLRDGQRPNNLRLDLATSVVRLGLAG